MRFRIAFISILALAHAISAQSPAYTPTMTFDVASIRQSSAEPGGPGVRGNFEPFDSSHLIGKNWDLKDFLVWAYDIDTQRLIGLDRLDFQLQHATFNVRAKADVAADEEITKLPKEQRKLEQMHMIQALLAERFSLKAHWVDRDTRVFDLVIARPGKLRTTGAAPGTHEAARFGNHDVPRLYQWGDSVRTEFIAHGATTGDIAEELSAHLGTLVRDKTKLTGRYDFDCPFAAFQTRGSDRAIDETNPWPPLEIAIRDELGLRLVQTHGPVPFLVIDSAQMPTEN